SRWPSWSWAWCGTPAGGTTRRATATPTGWRRGTARSGGEPSHSLVDVAVVDRPSPLCDSDRVCPRAPQNGGAGRGNTHDGSVARPVGRGRLARRELGTGSLRRVRTVAARGGRRRPCLRG